VPSTLLDRNLRVFASIPTSFGVLTNLYNIGFSGGLTATLFVAILEWLKTTKESRKEGTQ
jgi:ABC-type uncharacterized transport system permease subunit